MISTRDLSQLQGVDQLKSLTQSLAMLDAILSPEWEYRHYSFNAHWNLGEALASMRDGSGDEWFALFTPDGAIVKGFAHESPMSPYAKNSPAVWDGILDDVPLVFAGFLDEPAFSLSNTTFCVWCTCDETAWQRGNIKFPEGKDPDGSGDLLAILDGDPQTYQAWAECYFERPISLSAAIRIYEHQPLTEELITELNPSLTLRGFAQDIEEIAYAQERER